MGQDGTSGKQVVENRFSKGVQRSELVVDFQAGPVDRVSAGVHKIELVPVRAHAGLIHREIQQRLTDEFTVGVEAFAQKTAGGQDDAFGSNPFDRGAASDFQ